MEKTLIILKPDAVQRGLVGEVVTRFERVGLKIVGCKMLQPDYDHYYHHYETIGQMVTRRGKDKFDMTLDLMQEAPVIAMVLEGVEAVSLVRKMVGTTEPKEAVPGTIRGDYAHVSFTHADTENIGIPNIIHASGDPKEAKEEISHWFSRAELFDYSTLHQSYTQPRSKKKK
jgi:nucleoside-diphosphate kinase